MNYKRINEHEIEIIPEETPIDKILVTMARVSYESAKPPSSDFLGLLNKESEEMDFSEFVHLNSSEILNIDYVNERQCKTTVRRTDDGKYIFDAWLYESNRGKPEIFLNKVRSTLEDVEDSVVSVESDKLKSTRGWRLVRFLLELLAG